MTDQAKLLHYVQRFAHLKRGPHLSTGFAPHKPIFLLAILDAVEHGLVHENLVRITPELVSAFRARWRAIAPSAPWHENMALPFRHLTGDGFWELVKDGSPFSPASLGKSASVLRLSTLVDGGRIAPDLWQLLQDRTARHVLRTQIIETYFPDQIALGFTTIPADPLKQEVQRLLSEAQAKFRTKRLVETKDEDGAFLRHSAFPRVVRKLYDHSCAVCSLHVGDDKGGQVVDGAHILPFAEFHNDDPRNGIAMCKNHHWGFDRGWFSVADDYRLITSPRALGTATFVTAGLPIGLPSRTDCIPAIEALRWHRHKVLLK